MLSGLAIAARCQPDPLLAHTLASAQQGIESSLRQLAYATGERAFRLESLHHHHPQNHARSIDPVAPLRIKFRLEQAK